ncbi:MAG TPA: L-serine ammonia-lyase [Rhizomicrobium sp.]|jgi:L-serine dehydratase
MLSVLDLFRIGIGPSSSHTLGPIRICKRFLEELSASLPLQSISRIVVELQGSLALTGQGHGTPKAVLLGLSGIDPETIDPDEADHLVGQVCEANEISLRQEHVIAFNPERDIVFAYGVIPSLHPNGMKLSAFGSDGTMVFEETYYSTGGGFIATAKQLQAPTPNDRIASGHAVPFAFCSGAELLAHCARECMSIEEVIYANEDVIRPRAETDERLDRVVQAMSACVQRGLTRGGILPGSLAVKRRAPAIWRKLQEGPGGNEPERLFDWLNVYAMAVNEENASGGRVVTAPTNGAAGILPAILRHYCLNGDNATRDARRYLMTAGGVGLLYKQRASISGAEMGCQGEVGVACSMAAAGLAAIWGATPQQVANAAEIGMEHNLGLTCDPVGGLVQIPCIERNAVGAVKAVNAARLALHSTEPSKVSLDQVIETMRQTGLDMSSKYKETSKGGLAVNVVEC